MQVSLRIDSSFAAGLAAGLVTGAVAAQHLGWLVGLEQLCPALLRPATGGSKTAGARKGDAGAGTEAAASASESKDDLEERAAEREAFWFKEGLTPHFQVETSLKQILFDSRSDFQRVQVIETDQFGVTLVMDGQTQSAMADEHIYHESLVHPAMLVHGQPKTVFIGGGGEFATAREVLRHKSVERCVMVDIDKVACDICREQLPEWNGGAYEDSRFEVHYDDAKKWLEETKETFDVVIMDICDPIEAGPGYKLYTKEFYDFLHTKLNPGGVFVTQSGPGAVYNAKEECFTVIHNTLRSAFGEVVPYAVDVPSFGCNWGFNLAFSSKEGETRATILDTDIASFDAAVEAKIEGGAAKLRFLDGVSFRGAMGLPKEIRKHCEEEDRVMTIDNPVFMFAS